jgi:hypothetical protein
VQHGNLCKEAADAERAHQGLERWDGRKLERHVVLSSYATS